MVLIPFFKNEPGSLISNGSNWPDSCVPEANCEAALRGGLAPVTNLPLIHTRNPSSKLTNKSSTLYRLTLRASNVRRR